eukprot:CAMPEP_0168447490 /NCGR_PEP_ID=MMETSP0228-20121227/46614_1 /TAXON_ID=133427 /ORGANISM="Protoceratium reticulatum, Strain CCCM 535 (=CCMP 1889)" /LENGTH=61 /DNA_ID=CAMNT_0008462011 /DNA_START=63 /DNA_END=244 /DNA_ORIENTATION=-
MTWGEPESSSPATPQAGWTLLWCDELAFKVESATVRSSIAFAVWQSGGQLRCLKKADRLGA